MLERTVRQRAVQPGGVRPRGILLQRELQPVCRTRARLHARVLPAWATAGRTVRTDDLSGRSGLLQRELRDLHTARRRVHPDRLHRLIGHVAFRVRRLPGVHVPQYD